MNQTDFDDLIRRTLFSVAPDLEGLEINPDDTFRDQFEIDSMDTLNFIIGLSQATGLEIPEADYSQLETLAGCRTYLTERLRS